MGSADQVHPGQASIRSTVSNYTTGDYSVEILKVYPASRTDGRNLLLRVTDKALLEATGGIVQGMSGSPIIQDGKLIGIAAPQRRVYAKWGQMQFAEAAVIPSLGNEFYATLMAVDQQNRAVFRLSSNPLVNWLWLGGILMCLLPFVSFRRRNGREN